MLQKVNKYFYEIICNALASNWLKEFLSDLNLSGVFKCLHYRFGRETIANIIIEERWGGRKVHFLADHTKNIRNHKLLFVVDNLKLILLVDKNDSEIMRIT